MSVCETVKKGLAKTGKSVYISQGEWNSTPFYAVVAQKWRSNKSNFEPFQTPVGEVCRIILHMWGRMTMISVLWMRMQFCIMAMKNLFSRKKSRLLWAARFAFIGPSSAVFMRRRMKYD